MRIELKTRFCAGRHVRMCVNSIYCNQLDYILFHYSSVPPAHELVQRVLIIRHFQNDDKLPHPCSQFKHAETSQLCLFSMTVNLNI